MFKNRNVMNAKLQTLIKDCQTLLKVEEYVCDVKTKKLTSHIDELLNYAFSYDIITSVSDILEFSQAIPSLSKKVADMYDERVKKRANEEAQQYYKYAGTYDRLEDVPGYGTEWNNRCIPDGVVIRGGNRRC